MAQSQSPPPPQFSVAISQIFQILVEIDRSNLPHQKPGRYKREITINASPKFIIEVNLFNTFVIE